MKKFIKEYWLIIVTGLFIGAAAVLLTWLGNPSNMGFCSACFLRDIAGALKLQSAGATVLESGLLSAGTLQYARPEIIGLVVGALLISLVRKEWKPEGGSSPMTRFVIAVVVMVGALIFLGCPLRLAIRLGGGDLNALVGLAGLIVGVGIASVVVRSGFDLGKTHSQSVMEGLILPVIMVGLLVLLLAQKYLAFSTSGVGSQHAPILIALAVSVVIGALAFSSRFCSTGSFRDVMLYRDFKLISGYIAVIVAVLVGNIIVKRAFPAFSFEKQPIAHTDGLYNFLGMAMVGWGSVLLGGCPLRQLVRAGGGNTDSAVTVVGFIVGAAISHNFGLASSAAGIGTGPVAWVVTGGFAVLFIVSVVGIFRKKA